MLPEAFVARQTKCLQWFKYLHRTDKQNERWESGKAWWASVVNKCLQTEQFLVMLCKIKLKIKP